MCLLSALHCAHAIPKPWVSLDGLRVLRGKALFEADELQPKFATAMKRAGS
jgi:hypothetical protein